MVGQTLQNTYKITLRLVVKVRTRLAGAWTIFCLLFNSNDNVSQSYSGHTATKAASIHTNQLPDKLPAVKLNSCQL